MAALSLKGRKAKALYDFHGENEDELSFKVRMCVFFCNCIKQLYILKCLPLKGEHLHGVLVIDQE